MSKTKYLTGLTETLEEFPLLIRTSTICAAYEESIVGEDKVITIATTIELSNGKKSFVKEKLVEIERLINGIIVTR